MTALPYYVARAWGTREVHCGIAHCSEPYAGTLVSYDHRLGGAAILNIGVVLGGRRPPAVTDPRPARPAHD